MFCSTTIWIFLTLAHNLSQKKPTSKLLFQIERRNLHGATCMFIIARRSILCVNFIVHYMDYGKPLILGTLISINSLHVKNWLHIFITQNVCQRGSKSLIILYVDDITLENVSKHSAFSMDYILDGGSWWWDLTNLGIEIQCHRQQVGFLILFQSKFIYSIYDNLGLV